MQAGGRFWMLVSDLMAPRRRIRLTLLLPVALLALAAGVRGDLGLRTTIEVIGQEFQAGRSLLAIWLVLPLIAVLERHGLAGRAAALVRRGSGAGRVLLGWLLVRQATSAAGLVALAGQAHTVRPLLAPMAEAAAGSIDEAVRRQVRAHAAATDNVALLFGQNLGLAVVSVAIVRHNLWQHGYEVAAAPVALWAVPAAVAALLIHAGRLLLLDRAWRKAASR